MTEVLPVGRRRMISSRLQYAHYGYSSCEINTHASTSRRAIERANADYREYLWPLDYAVFALAIARFISDAMK